MKDAVITVRLPRETRERIEKLARHEGRSLSQQVERLIIGGLEGWPSSGPGRPPGAAPLAGVLRGGPVPALADFRRVRSSLSASLRGRLAKRRDGRR